MKLLYDKPPSAAELAEFGVRPEDFPPVNHVLWDENWPAFDLYVKYSTQWIHGPGGPAGLNYPVLLADLDRHGIDAREIERVMDGIRVIESAVLDLTYKDE